MDYRGWDLCLARGTNQGPSLLSKAPIWVNLIIIVSFITRIYTLELERKSKSRKLVYIYIYICPCVRACVHMYMCICMYMCMCMCVRKRIKQPLNDKASKHLSCNLSSRMVSICAHQGWLPLDTVNRWVYIYKSHPSSRIRA